VSPSYFYWRYLFGTQVVGVVFLVLGLASVRKQLSFRPDSYSVLGWAFVPASLTLFGAGHLFGAKFLVELVPAWMPARLFWVYFVGVALIAASASIVAGKYVHLSASLLGTMFFVFVLTIHLPTVVKNPHDRFRCAVAARDFVFGVGAWALAASQMEKQHRQLALRLIASCRVAFGLVLMFFGVEHVLHPGYLPGVPLDELTPPWVPFPSVWGYAIGAMLMVSGVLLLINVGARVAATWLGIAMTIAVLILYVPMLPVARLPSEINTADNFIADTLLFAGSIFFLAEAMPASSVSSDSVREAA
jgi:uncharacterized membrane protein